MGGMSTVQETLSRAVRIALLHLLACGLFHPLPASAQGIKAMMEALGRAPKPVTPELPPAAQLDWAKAQIEAANTAFSPYADAVADAHKIQAAFALPENAGKSVISIDGRMVERLHLAQAERLLARANVTGDRP